jgi:hypothetical protein
VEKQPNLPLSALTKALLTLYLAFAAASAVMLLWLLLWATTELVPPLPPEILLVAPIILMLVVKIAGAWAYRRDVRSAQRLT